jgi:hypothetical protein
LGQTHEARIVLFLDDSWESKEAHKVFVEKGLHFEVMRASGADVPGVRVGNTYYSGLRRLDVLAEHLRSS